MRLVVLSWLVIVGLLAASACLAQCAAGIAEGQEPHTHSTSPAPTYRGTTAGGVTSGGRPVSRGDNPVSVHQAGTGLLSEHPDTYVWLAQLCVSESGWSSPADCAAIHAVLRATRRSDELLVETMLRHAPRLFGLRRARHDAAAARHRWVRGLRADGEEPEHWPLEHGDWGRYRPRWLEVLVFARRLVAGETRARCERAPIAWGGAMDDHVALRRGLVRVDCGATSNRYWARPEGGES